MTTKVLSHQLVLMFRTLDRDWRRRTSHRGGVITVGGALEEGGVSRTVHGAEQPCDLQTTLVGDGSGCGEFKTFAC